MVIIDCEQGTDEWLLARLGRASASQFNAVLAKARNPSDEASTRRNYRVTVALERVTGQPLPHYRSEHMDWGHDTEDLARTSYMISTGNIVDQIGFAQHDVMMAGASPDGLIGTDGGIEIKCKVPANHLESLRLRRMPGEHRAQVQGNLWIFEREWWDYVSFDPRFPNNAQLMIDRVYRDDAYIKYLETEVTQFLEEVAEDVEFIKGYGPGAPSPSPMKISELFN